MPEWLLPTATFIAGAAATWLLLRIRFERFEAMDTRREADWTAWRKRLDEWVLAKEQHDRDWRHDDYAETIDGINARLLPLLSEASLMKERIAKLEGRVFNGYSR